MSIRTIFLMIRGSYQAGMATRMARQDLRKLGKAQQEIVRRTEDMMRAANQWIFAGAAFTTFGAMMTKAFMRVMESSAAGQRALMNFSRRTQQSMARISEAFSPIMGDILNIVAGFMELVSVNPVLRMIAVAVMLIVGPLLTLGGMALLASGGVKVLRAGLAVLGKRSLEAAGAQKVLQPAMVQMGFGATTASQGVNTLTISMRGLVSVLTRGLFYFTMVYTVAKMIESTFGTLAGVVVALIAVLAPFVALLWGGAAAMSVLTWGAAALAGAAAIGTIVQSIPAYQAGTTFVKEGGLAVLHGGEEITSARERRVISRIEKQTQGKTQANQISRSNTTITATIGTVYTKSDLDDVQEKVSMAIKEAVDNKI